MDAEGRPIVVGDAKGEQGTDELSGPAGSSIFVARFLPRRNPRSLAKVGLLPIDGSFAAGGVFAIGNQPRIGPPIPTARGGAFALASGSTGSHVLELDATGHPVPSFAAGGWRNLRAGEGQRLFPIGGGGIGVLHLPTTYPRNVVTVQRLRRDGSLDRRYGDDGAVRISLGNRLLEWTVAAGDRHGGLFVATTWHRPKGAKGAQGGALSSADSLGHRIAAEPICHSAVGCCRG